MAQERQVNGRRRIWAPVWSIIAWFALLRASGVQWSVVPDSVPHIMRIAAAYAIVVPIMAYAIALFGKRLRFVAAVIVLDIHVVTIAWLHARTTTVPALEDVAWSFAGVAIGAMLAAALESSASRALR